MTYPSSSSPALAARPTAWFVSLLLAGLSLIGTSCGRCGVDEGLHVSYDSAAGNVTYNIGVLDGGGSTVEINGVRIELSSEVHSQFPLASVVDIQAFGGRQIASNSPDGTLIVDQRILELREDHLHWGGEDYGVVSSESQIRIDAAGLHIDGRLVEPVKQP